jgi:hypothetical protein
MSDPERKIGPIEVRWGDERYTYYVIWGAAGFIDTLLRWKMKLEVVHGNEKAIQP